MQSVKSFWSGIRNTFRPNETVEVYSHKFKQWVTVVVPKGRRDLLEAELQRLENIEDIALKQKKPLRLTGFEERNEWIRNVEVSISTRPKTTF
jgi:hypothetical protein